MNSDEKKKDERVDEGKKALKYEKPGLFSLNRGAGAVCSPTGSGASTLCFLGNGAGSTCTFGTGG